MERLNRCANRCWNFDETFGSSSISSLSNEDVGSMILSKRLTWNGRYKRGKYVTQDITSQKMATAEGWGMITKNPQIIQKKNVMIRNQSISDRSGLSTIVTVMNIRRGPDEHHSPQIVAGDATLWSWFIYWKIIFDNTVHTVSNSLPQYINADTTPIKE